MISYFVVKLLQRSYRFLLLTFFSLLIGAFLFGGVVSLVRSIQSFLVAEGKVLVGGDVILRSAYPIATTSPLFKGLVDKGHIVVEEQQVQAVFRNEKTGASSPADSRIVGNLFPLYGNVLLENGVFDIRSGGVYMEQELLTRLGATVGEEVTLGTKKLLVRGVIIKEPDNLSIGFSFTPRAILSQNDFKESGINLFQSRTSYRLYLKEGSTEKLTDEEVESIRTYASLNKLRFDDATDGPNRLVRGLSSVTTFIGIVLTIALFLVTVNIVANLVYLLARFKKTIALLKTFGATNAQIQKIYLYILALLGGSAGFVGALAGAHLVTLLLPRLSSLLQVFVQPENEILIGLGGGFFGIIFIVCASAPFLYSLRSIVPKELFSAVAISKKDYFIKRVMLFLPIPIVLTVLLYGISGDFFLVMYSIAGLVVIFSFFVVISYFSVEALYVLRNRFPFIVSSIISFLKWRGLQTYVATASIMTAFCGVFIVAAIESNITANISKNISTTAPALYLVDINKSQLEPVRAIVGESLKEYPIIRGRLLSVNERDLTTSDDPGVTREFNLTYRNNLIEGERVLEGVFGEKENQVGNVVSIDKQFAEEIGGVKLGDSIRVFIQGITVTATVTSIREVDSSSGIPFFYLVYGTSVLSNFPSSFFATVQTNDVAIKSIKNALSAQFPNIIPIETKKVLESVASVVNNVLLLVILISIPSIILGLMLIIIMISQSVYERKGDVMVLRAFGFEKKKITLLFVLEAGALLFVSGFIAYLIAHSVSFALNYFVFSFEIFSFATKPFYMIIITMVLVGVFSYILSTQIVHSSLKKLLSEK